MRKTIHLWPRKSVEEGSQTKVSFILELPKGERIEVWYRIDEPQKDSILESCDPFIIPSVYLAMQEGADLKVHGQASPSLLRNLDELQQIWKMWRPKTYTKIDITAENETELQLPQRKRTLLAYSGGVDSCYSFWRNRHGLAGRQSHPDLDGLYISGFDIRLSQPEVRQRIYDRQKEILAHQGSSLLHMVTNLKKIGNRFDDVHSAILASCMMLLGKTYSTGLIAATRSYQDFNRPLPWGSITAIDRLYTSTAFETIHDGMSDRIEKIRLISEWSEAVRHLRVCLRGKERDVNCGKCEKCVRTILEFRILGLGLPECFSQDVSDREIRNLRYPSLVRSHYYNTIIKIAKEKRMQAPWINALKTGYRINKVRGILGSFFREQFD